MSVPDPAGRRLIPAAALVSLFVLLLGVTGLFALSYTNAKSVAALERLGRFHAAQTAAVQSQISFKTQVQEWKNLLLRGTHPKDYALYLAGFEQREADVRTNLASLQSELARLELDSLSADSLLAAHIALGITYRDALAAYVPASPETAFTVDATIRGIDRQLNDDIDSLARSVQRAAENNLDAFRAASDARYATLRKVIVALATLTMLFAFWLVFQTARLPRGAARRA